MLRTTLAAAIALFLAFGAAAEEEPRILKRGDVIELDEGETLTLQRFRTVLKEYGYYSLGPGGQYGRILTITAFAHNRDRYQLKAHTQTGEITRAVKARNFWY